MKKVLLIAVVVAVCVVVMTGCSLLSGKDGKAYVKVTFDTAEADGVMGNFDGLPTSAQVNTEYEVDPSSYTGDYVLYWSEYIYDSHGSGSYWHYHTHFNQSSFFSLYGTIYGPSSSSNVTYYTSNFYTSYHNDVVYSITVNKGSFPFKNGTDKHFTIALAWYPSETTISSSAVAASEARIIEDSPDRIVKELTDGDYTLRLEMKKGNVPAPKSLKSSQ
jgi:hypothetical protein